MSAEINTEQSSNNVLVGKSGRKHGLVIGFWNIQHLSNKIDQLKLYLNSDNLNSDIMFMAETFLSRLDSDAVFAIPGMLMERKDRIGRIGGGIVVYIRSNISFTRRLDLESPELEIMWIEILQPNCNSFLLAGVYRPPDTLRNCDVLIENNLERGYLLDKELYILGDFNIDLLAIRGQQHYLYKSLSNMNLNQLISQPTRPLSNTCLDHIYTTNREHVSSVYIPNIGLSDHYPIVCCRKINSNFVHASSHVTAKFRSFKLFDEMSFLRDISDAPWDLVHAENNVDTAMNLWVKIFNNICDLHAPFVEKRVKRFKQPGWMNNEILNAMHDRDLLLRQSRFDSAKVASYRQMRNRVVHMVKSAKKSQFNDVLSKNGAMLVLYGRCIIVFLILKTQRILHFLLMGSNCLTILL